MNKHHFLVKSKGILNKAVFFILPRSAKIKAHLKKHYSDELLLMKGKHPARSRNQSILFFTVHRCASRYVTNIIKNIVDQADMTHIDIGGYLWRGGKVYIDPSRVYIKRGYFYGPFYELVPVAPHVKAEDLRKLNFDPDSTEEPAIPIPGLDGFKIILMLRDPRDVLTSYYFHHAYEIYDNPAQQKYIIERSKNTLSKTIDEWVMEKAPIFLRRYATYCEKVLSRPDVLFLRYEDMIQDFPAWLDKLIRFIGIAVKDEIKEDIIRKASFKVEKENVKAHKRQVTPGDHKRKLKKETIDELNRQFGEILALLGYE